MTKPETLLDICRELAQTGVHDHEYDNCIFCGAEGTVFRDFAGKQIHRQDCPWKRMLDVIASPVEPSAESDEQPVYDIEFALNIAKLWRVGKMIGGDQDAVREALLAEVERLRENRSAEP